MAEYKNYDYLRKKTGKVETGKNEMPADGGDPNETPRRPKNLFLFYILPFIILNLIIFYLATAQPDFKLTVGDPTDYKSVSVSVSMNGFLPVKNFSVKLGDTPLEMKAVGNKTYTAVLSTNGTLEVKASYFNGMEKTQYELISSIDDVSPVISSQDISNGVVTISLEDSQSGVDYSTIYAIDANNANVAPSDYDEKDSLVTFQTATDSLEVHVRDKVGNEAVATFDSLSLAMSHGDAAGTDSGTDNAAASKNSASSSAASAAKETTKAAAKTTTRAADKTTAARETTRASSRTATKASSKAQTKAAEKTTTAKETAAKETTKASSKSMSGKTTGKSSKATAATKESAQ